jgi:hemoglobin
MARTALTLDTLPSFIAAFYTEVRHDPLLGPVFAVIPHEAWPAHLDTVARFWASVLFKSGSYKGNPFASHVGKGISPEHFERWLAVFSATASERFTPEDAGVVVDRAHRIAASLKAGLFLQPATARPGI